MTNSKETIIVSTLILLFWFCLLGFPVKADIIDTDPNLTECSDWVNCNPNPPSFDGICCRICFFKNLGHREWDCAVHSEKDAGFSQNTKDKMKKRNLYDGVDPTLKDLFIMELDVTKGN